MHFFRLVLTNKNYMRLLITMFVLLFNLSLFAPNLSDYYQEQSQLNRHRVIRLEYLMDAEFSESNLLELLIILDAPSPEIIMKQAKIESGWFKSPLFKNHNAIFGMHYPLVRDSYAFEYTIADKGRKVASYRSWQSSTLDVLLLIQYYEDKGFSSIDYYKFLEDIHYCELGGDYIKLLKSMA